MAVHPKIHRITTITHLMVLGGAAAIIITASIDAFSSMSFEASTRSQHLQLGICALIFVDLVLEFMVRDHKLQDEVDKYQGADAQLKVLRPC